MHRRADRDSALANGVAHRDGYSDSNHADFVSHAFCGRTETIADAFCHCACIE